MSWNVADVTVFAGRFGSTSRQPVLVTGDGGESFSADLHRSINLATDPELLDQWASGELHVATDPETETSHRLTMPLACHDPRRRVFVLLVPDELRWCEFRLRQDLLDELSRETVPVPSYVRNFEVIYDIAKLRELESGAFEEEIEAPTLGSELSEELRRKSRLLEETNEKLRAERAELDEANEQLRIERERLDEAIAKLESTTSKLGVERSQLNELRARFDREREQMEEFEARLQAERAEFDEMKAQAEADRRELLALRLNEEGRALSAATVGSASTVSETTQVVTDDQFIEIVDETAIEESFAEDSEVEVEEVSADDPNFITIEPTDRAPRKFSDLLSGNGRTRAVKIVQGRVVAVAQLPKDRIERLLGDDPTCFIQLHEIEGYPLITLLIAQLDEKQQAKETFAWALDPASDADRLLLDRLQKEAAFTVALYGRDGNRVQAVHVQTPFASNVEWIRRRADTLLQSAKVGVAAALETFYTTNYESLGTMRHNFSRDSFTDATATSQIKLAAGIVGYWSQADTFEYLVANRCFPLHHFRAIQERVVRRAAEAGIFLNRPLRQVAIDLGLAPNEDGVCELLVANFAEASVALRANDLEPAEQWENWDALLGLGDELGLPADPEVVELAEVSLKRAQEAEELSDRVDAELETLDDTSRRQSEQELVVAKRSESTGVTYFLPNDAVLDTFDDLATMDRSDLELLLNDANGRLEAAQMLIERFGSAATAKVLETAESMNVSEVAAIAKFLETKAGGLEGELVRGVESGGPNGAFIAASALGKMKSTSAIPALIEAMQDDKRQFNRDRFAEALAEYGDKILPALTRAIKRDGPGDHLVLLLSCIEENVSGTLSSLSKDRSKNLREAARLARQKRESKTA